MVVLAIYLVKYDYIKRQQERGRNYFLALIAQQASQAAIVVNRQLAETLQIYHNWETPTVFSSISWLLLTSIGAYLNKNY